METFKGQEQFKAPPEKVYHALTDLTALSKHIPNLDSSTLVDPKTLKAVVRPGFSFVRGTLKLTIQLVEATPHSHAFLKITAGGIGMGMDIESRLNVSPGTDTGTSTLDWETQVVKRSGLLALVGAGLIQGAAEKTIQQGWESLRKEVEV